MKAARRNLRRIRSISSRPSYTPADTAAAPQPSFFSTTVSIQRCTTTVVKRPR
jgi:hypothetical protein